MRAAESADERLPDAVAGHFLLRWAPAPLRPFVQLARLDRPIGWQLLLLPCWEGSALASAALGRPLDLLHLILFFIGAVSMRGAGSTYNDIVDRDIDAKVERTRGRPLASGRASLRAAIVFLVLQCLVGLGVLLSFNGFTIALAFASPLIVLIYPFAKRITSWPQAVLGLAFAYGALLGWTAQAGALGWPAVLLYLAAILWTIGYDTIYALQDKRDDVIAGVRSTALLFGARVRLAVGTLYAASALCAELAVLTAHLGVAAHLGVLAYTAHLSWQVSRTGPSVAPATALMLFRSNRDAGFLLFAGLAIAALLSQASA
ncbi:MULTISPECIES: 4-hydroxybenzoate octaprenyltransferase [Methylosinus]|uniref:4-hydroxybenzoate octaprenyltransferase n=1 Tax=Methylosinus trichosporium (strain ATCC 35070 / NCIMB 11131 / UNIQEM 75 / OB3b) TaxID=595536 RepID=A0A2D2D3B8_METT3|nr:MULTISPECIES: 4-hydroxybenzoate octaprenyltransferase [Methylosinus]ATQ69488.1 4-hydroxybenzoate octaprenyltransferase [Methylosinus trichosporium OB3b]OBS51938.1 4-hydroxybenzoate polyprenyltransferase [Methylosinus sp. 3S-1]